MKALILCAGEGTRLRPLTEDLPKAMLPVGGEPLLAHLLRLVASHGVREVAINLHYLPDAITDFAGDGSRFGLRIIYSHEPELLGSAGAARKLRSWLDENFLVIYGDLLTDLDLTALADSHAGRGGPATVALYQVPDPGCCGVVETDEAGRITRFIEKPPPDEVFSDWVNAGVYVLEPRAIDAVPENRFYDFGHDLFPLLLQHGEPLYGYRISDYLIDIGSIEKYEQAERDWQAGRVRAPDAALGAEPGTEPGAEPGTEPGAEPSRP